MVGSIWRIADKKLISTLILINFIDYQVGIAYYKGVTGLILKS